MMDGAFVKRFDALERLLVRILDKMESESNSTPEITAWRNNPYDSRQALPPFAAALVPYLKRYGSKKELAEKLGVHQSTVTNWASGKSEPTTSRWPEIERALGLELGELMHGAILASADR